jgi:alkylhydroperoxidase family enzyme
LQGDEYGELSRSIRDGRLDDLPVGRPERLLLEYVRDVTLHAHRVTDEEVEGLRQVGWTDAQIAEATYEAALFSFFVRMADAFGIDPSPEWDADGVPRALDRAAEGD